MPLCTISCTMYISPHWRFKCYFCGSISIGAASGNNTSLNEKKKNYNKFSKLTSKCLSTLLLNTGGPQGPVPSLFLLLYTNVKSTCKK